MMWIVWKVVVKEVGGEVENIVLEICRGECFIMDVMVNCVKYCISLRLKMKFVFNILFVNVIEKVLFECIL